MGTRQPNLHTDLVPARGLEPRTLGLKVGRHRSIVVDRSRRRYTNHRPESTAVGGLGNIYGAILGGFLFAGLQTIGAVALPFASAYKDVFALAVVIIIMTFRPTGLIAEKSSERV